MFSVAPSWVLLAVLSVVCATAVDQEHSGARGWIRVASFAETDVSVDPQIAGVAKYLCQDGAWDMPWQSVRTQHVDEWGQVTMKLRQASPRSAPFDKDLELIWRQPPSLSACLFQDSRSQVELLEVRQWDGNDSPLLVAVANHWPFSGVLETIWGSMGKEFPVSGGAELWVCSHCALVSSLWPAIKEACYHATRYPVYYALLKSRVCRTTWHRQQLLLGNNSTTPPAGLALSNAERFYAIMWLYLQPNQPLSHRKRLDMLFAQVPHTCNETCVHLRVYNRYARTLAQVLLRPPPSAGLDPKCQCRRLNPIRQTLNPKP